MLAYITVLNLQAELNGKIILGGGINENTSNIRGNTRYIFTTGGQYYDPIQDVPKEIFRSTLLITKDLVLFFRSDTEGASTYIEWHWKFKTLYANLSKAEKAIIDFIKNYDSNYLSR